MPFVSGYLNLGTSIVSGAAVVPPSGTGYAPQPILFQTVGGGIILNSNATAFGPVSGAALNPWGTLSVFSITDVSGNTAWTGTLLSPVTPVSGAIVNGPIGSVAITLNQQIAVSDMASGLIALNEFALLTGAQFRGDVQFPSGVVAAASGGQAGAAPLPYMFNRITAAASGEAVVIVSGAPRWMRNDSAFTVNVYAPSGLGVNNAPANTPISLSVSGTLLAYADASNCSTY